MTQLSKTLLYLSFFLLGYIYCFPTLGQTFNTVEETKIEIKRLLDVNKIVAVNTLIKKSPFLDIEYRLEVLNKNIEIASSMDNPDILANTYLALGNFWHEQSNKVKAFEYYLLSENLAVKTNNFRLQGLSMMNRSTLLENNEDRLAMVKKSIYAFEKAKDTLNLAKAHLNTGVNFGLFFNSVQLKDTLHNRELHADIEYYKKNMFEHYLTAQSLGAQLKSNEIRAMVNIYYAEWHEYEGQLVKAKKLYETGRDFSKLSGFLKGEVYCIKEIASIEKRLGKEESMWKLLALAESLAKTHNYKAYLQEIYEEYIIIYTSTGNYRKALEYQKSLMRVSLDLVTSGNQNELRILGLQNDLSENAYQLEKMEIQQVFNKWIIVFSIFISVFIAITAILTLKNRKRKMELIKNNNTITTLEKCAIERELKNKHLEEELLKKKIRFGQEHLMHFSHQVMKIENFFILLKRKIKELQYKEENQAIINELKISFSEIARGQNHLKQLNSYTSQLNQNFFFHITQQYPSITNDDEQLLAYIILNMDSKEIGRILNITTDSVYKKRHRLRKKLGLSNDCSFHDFYDTITCSITHK